MKLNKSEQTAVNTYELEIFIEPETIKQASGTVYRRDAKKYNVPGFRKGKAPRHLIEKMYGENVFVYDAVEEVFPEAYEAAAKEADIEPVARPDVELVSADVNEGATVKVKVVVKPELKLGKYFGLSVEKPCEKPSEEKIDEEIEGMRQRNARILTREGAAENGDIANIDYEGFVNDVPFDGGKDEGHKLNLGSGQFIAGFEEQVVGHRAGEEFDVNVTFPEEYHSKELSGKAAVFKVKLNEVQMRELPDIDDEFAKDVSEFDTIDELKASIRERMQKELDDAAEIEVENRLVGQIVDTMQGEIPAEMYETRMDDMVRDFAFRLEQQGMNLKTYMQFSGGDAKQFREGFRENAEKQVKMRLALESIVKLEGITATDEDIDAEVARISEKYKMEPDKVSELMPTEEIAKDLAVNKALDMIKEKAVITDEKKQNKE